MKAQIYDETRCQLGEGPLWHPLRNELIWFDILGQKLHRRGDNLLHTIALDEITTAAAWVDETRLLLASETGLSLFDLNDQSLRLLAPLEAGNPLTRSNDGRADRQGGFWIGTMGKRAETGAGAIYRFYRGEVRKLYSDITISNAICFAPDGQLAYWADTAKQQIMAQPLDAEGWPQGAPRVFVDLTAEKLSPDGAVVDAAGHLWNAQWGAGRVAEYDPSGKFLRALPLPARQATCPAFGGPDLTSLICTSAAAGMADDGSEAAQAQGQTFIFKGVTKGQAEARVLL